MATDNLTPEDKMKTLQAGDKAVYHCTDTFKEIVNVLYVGEKAIRVQLIDGDKDIFHVTKDELSPVYIVRVLQDGTAREVNPLGERPRITTTFIEFAQGHEKVFEDQIRNEKWHEAESQCLTLECEPHEVDGLTGKIFFMSCDWTKDIAGQLWYALLSSDKFTLIKPITHEK